jgi:PAS domain S-box-containing protein
MPSNEDPTVYQAMFDQARDGRFVLDAEANILHANPAAVRLFRALEGTLRGLPFSELLTPAALAGFRGAMEATRIHPSRVGPVPLTGRAADGSTFPIEVEVIHGTETRYGVVVRDGRTPGRVSRIPGPRFNPGQMLIASRIQELV